MKSKSFTNRGFFTSAKRILSQPSFLYLLILWLCGGHVMVGIITFIPKYMETQFGLPAASANMFYGKH